MSNTEAQQEQALKILMTSVREDEVPAIKAYQERTGVQIITSPVTINDCRELLDGVDGLVIQQRCMVPEDLYEELAAKGIPQIATRTAGYDVIDLNLARKAGLKVTNVPAYSPRSVAEHALMQILRLIRKSYVIDKRVSQHDYTWAGAQALEIHSITVGIIGAGRIGSTLARMLHALGATVLAHDLVEYDELKDIVTYTTKEDLLKRSDVVTLHVDLNETSKGLLGASELALMKPGSYLVNASRGPVIDTEALIDALARGPLAAAALDTVEGEETVFSRDLSDTGIVDRPLIAKLQQMDNVLLTPHVAFFTNIAVQNMVDISLDDAIAVVTGNPCEHIVS